jgi:hypothetical protein
MPRRRHSLGVIHALRLVPLVGYFATSTTEQRVRACELLLVDFCIFHLLFWPIVRIVGGGRTEAEGGIRGHPPLTHTTRRIPSERRTAFIT